MLKISHCVKRTPARAMFGEKPWLFPFCFSIINFGGAVAIFVSLKVIPPREQ